MEYLDAVPDMINIVIGPLILAGFMLAAGLLCRVHWIGLLIVTPVAFVFGVVFMTTIDGWVTAPHDQYEAQIREVYGIEVDSVRELNFPTDRPDGREAFGSTTAIRDAGDDVERLEVELVWDGVQFALFDADGAPLEPLDESSR